MDYLRLFLYNKRLLSFGFLLTFCSGFGKTFLLSIYVPDFIRDFSLSNTQFGLLYAMSTIASGILLMYFGRLIDSTKLKKYVLYVTIGLAISCLLVTFSHSILFLALGIFGLRLTGQGLMSHTSLTTMTRYFKRSRGKAISISLLGHPLGVAILPAVIVGTKHIYGWRTTMVLSAVFLALILFPFILSLFRKKPKAVELIQQELKKDKLKKKTKSNWTIRKIISNKRFFQVAPSILVLAFISTGLMFYIVPMAQYKGWTQDELSTCFMAFALTSGIGSIFAGKIIDKYKAMKLFPFYLLPLTMGMLIVLASHAHIAGLIYFALLGTTVGLGVSVESAVLAEVYGLKCLGTVRSLYSSLVIFSTALGPLIMGAMLDHGFYFDTILEIGIAFIILAMIFSLKINSKISGFRIRSWKPAGA